MAQPFRSLILSVAIFIFGCGSIVAQLTPVTFKIINFKKKAVPFASVSVHLVNDTINTINRVSDSLGKIRFPLQLNKQYQILVSSINYTPLEKGIIVKSENQIINLLLENNSKALKGITITATKPIMRQEDDKTIVDPENLAISSTNAYEILEKTPGLFLDQDGNIYLNSTTPATIYINGREQKMSAADIAAMLKNLPPNSIASIEILRTPSAKYDASGTGGIVNVVLKKGVKIGLTGSVNLGANQGKYGNEFVGLNLNNNNGVVTTYLNMQYSRRNNYDETKTDRIFARDSLLSQDATTIYPTNSYFFSFGINYILNKKWELNLDTRVNFSDFLNTTDNNSTISKISANKVLTHNISNVTNNGNSFYVSQGTNLKYKIDSLGSEWTTDLNYNYAPNNSNQNFITTYDIPISGAFGGDGDLKTTLNYFSAQSNVLLKYKNKLTLEMGGKTSFVNFNNSTDYFKSNNQGRVKDFGRTSKYAYNENINALYFQASKTISGITFKAGTRVENTNMNGNQTVPTDTSFHVRRTDAFPYVFISKTLFKIFSYELKGFLVYRRTISRPGYQLLNPSLKYIDQYLYETGNPSLRPQFTQNLEANVSVDERPIIAIGTNNTKDIFTNVVYQSDSNRAVSYRTYDNLGTNKEIYFRALGAIPPGKKYFIVAGVQFNHNFYNGYYENQPLLFKKGSWSIFTYQTFKLTKNTQLSLNGFARFNGQLQFYELSNFGALNFSVNQQLFKKKMTISASLQDIFETNNNHFVLKQGSQNASGFRAGDTRRVGLNLRYNFGIRKREDNNMMNVDSPEKTN